MIRYKMKCYRLYYAVGISLTSTSYNMKLLDIWSCIHNVISEVGRSVQFLYFSIVSSIFSKSMHMYSQINVRTKIFSDSVSLLYVD